MSRKLVHTNVTQSGGFVNLLASISIIAVIGVGYFAALGQFASVA